MGTTIKRIGDGEPYHIRFEKTIVYKRVFGEEEQKIDEYYYEDGDEYYSEIIWQVPINRGLVTWFNFNKVERLEQLDVIDYHKNIFMGDFDYNQQNDIEYVVSQAADGQLVHLTIQKNRHGHMADIMIAYPDWYIRIHLEQPTEGIFDELNIMIKEYTLLELGDREDYSLGEKILIAKLAEVKKHPKTKQYSYSLTHGENFLFLLNEKNKSFFLNDPNEIKEIDISNFEEGTITFPDGRVEKAWKHYEYLKKKRDK